jgi:hypothetical protein
MHVEFLVAYVKCNQYDQNVSGWAHIQVSLLLFSEKYLVLICAYCSYLNKTLSINKY